MRGPEPTPSQPRSGPLTRVRRRLLLLELHRAHPADRAQHLEDLGPGGEGLAGAPLEAVHGAQELQPLELEELGVGLRLLRAAALGRARRGAGPVSYTH